MVSTIKKPARLTRWLAFGATLMFSTACQSVDTKAAVEEVKLPPNTRAGIVIGNDGQFAVFDQDGKRIPPCQLCTKELEGKYGAYCQKATREANICDGVTSATVQSIDSIVILQSHKNPHCMTIRAGGYTFTAPTPCLPQ